MIFRDSVYHMIQKLSDVVWTPHQTPPTAQTVHMGLFPQQFTNIPKAVTILQIVVSNYISNISIGLLWWASGLFNSLNQVCDSQAEGLG